MVVEVHDVRVLTWDCKVDIMPERYFMKPLVQVVSQASPGNEPFQNQM